MRSNQFTVRRLLLIMVAVAGVMGLLSATIAPSQKYRGLASATYTDKEGVRRSYLYQSEFYVANGRIVEWGVHIPRVCISVAMLLAVGFLWKKSASKGGK